MALVTKHFFPSDSQYYLKANQVLKTSNLHVSFKVKNGLLQAVRGVSLSAYKGQIVGIVGESGSGKSVSVKSLLGFNFNALMRAEMLNLNNINLLKIKNKDWIYIRGSHIAYIPQDPLFSLNPTKPIGKQIREAVYISQKRRFQQQKADLKVAYKKRIINYETFQKKFLQLKQKYQAGILKKNIDQKIIEILTFIGINDIQKRLHSYPHEFSGGMRQRIVIAIAVASEPDVIIADEPTTALDVTIQAKILDLIKKLREKYHITIIFISHNIALVANFCDYVYVMYAGKVVEQGLVHELFLSPKHPYTWALLESLPDSLAPGQKLKPIMGSPPNMVSPPKGDAFALRNKYAMRLDLEKQPPLFSVTKTHKAATWLLHPLAPKVKVPETVQFKIKQAKKAFHIYAKNQKNNTR